MNKNVNAFFSLQLPCKFDDILEALENNALGVVFFVDKNLRLLGVISDGDIRRFLLKHKHTDIIINENSLLLNKKPVWLPYDADVSMIWKILDSGIRCVPLLDKEYKILEISTKERIRKFPISSPIIGELEIKNVLDCMSSGWISSQGAYIDKFENQFSKYLGGGYSVAVSNGTVALQLSLAVFDIGAGDEVILPDFTFGATINSIIHSGATPVLVDVDIDDWTISLQAIENSITSKTKAIMPVHIYGQPAKIDEITNMAKKYNLVVIEDCAESLGAEYKSRLVGLDSPCSCFSFFANKTITTGEGGMIVFKDLSCAKKAKVLRDHGMDPEKKYWHLYPGFNYRMTNLQAAIGVAQISRLTELLEGKKVIFENYNEILKGCNDITILPNNNWSSNSYWLYTVLLKSFGQKARDILIKKLSKRGIDARPGFYPLHQMEPFKKYSNTRLSNSIYLSENTISLPSSANLSKFDVSHIANIFIEELSNIKEFYGP